MGEIELTPVNGIPADDFQSLARLELASDGSLNTRLKPHSFEHTLHEFEARFPDTLALFEQVGIHPTKSDIPHNPYTDRQASESFTNIGEHCLAVGYAASKIMDALAEAGVVKSEDADSVIVRALVHDITKPYEIMRRDAKRAGLAEEVYSVAAYEHLRPLLVRNGTPDEIAAYLVHAGAETGHNSLKTFIVVDSAGGVGISPGMAAEKIVHLADDMTFTSNPSREGEAPTTLFLTPWERMLAANFVEKYPWMWKEGLGVDSSGQVVTVDNVEQPVPGVAVIGDYAALQVKVAGAICREFKLFLDPGSMQEPEQFIKALING